MFRFLQQEWFDTFTDLQAVLNVDLQREMGRSDHSHTRIG